jgi:hypothetical protein
LLIVKCNLHFLCVIGADRLIFGNSFQQSEVNRHFRSEVAQLPEQVRVECVCEVTLSISVERYLPDRASLSFEEWSLLH